MIPYANFTYFAMLLYVAIPTLLIRCWGGRVNRIWILATTILVILVQYLTPTSVTTHLAIHQVWIVLAYAGFQYLVLAIFLRIRRRQLARRQAGADSNSPAVPGASSESSRVPYMMAIALSLLPLAIAKFVPLACPSTQIGFLGISYVTFRALDLVFSIQDKLVASLPLGEFVAYLFFFPTLSSGPIDRWRRFDADWKWPVDRPGLREDLDKAVHRIFDGFLYKFIIAYLIDKYWVQPATAASGFIASLAYMYGYSLYLFFDFAGYSHFAIGLSYLFGIHSPENFNRPFLARNIKDFWNRWHMSLSFWFRDHIYMRFVMRATQGKWFKNRYSAAHLGYFVSFGLMGLWHGTQSYYLLYGIYHGALLSGYDAFSRWNNKRPQQNRRKIWGDGPAWKIASIIVTFHMVCFGFLLFSGHLFHHGTATGMASPGARLAHFEGTIDQLDCHFMRGWADDTIHPDDALDVQLFEGQKLLGSAVADAPRRDLRESGHGNGRHGFAIETPKELRDGKTHTISLRVAGSSEEIKSRSFQCVDGRSSSPGGDNSDGGVEPASAGMGGAVNRADCTRILGWAWDKNHPNDPVEVVIIENANVIAKVKADVFRKDLLNVGKGNGVHGFSFVVPGELKDNSRHIIHLMISTSGVELRNSPVIIECQD